MSYLSAESQLESMDREIKFLYQKANDPSLSPEQRDEYAGTYRDWRDEQEMFLTPKQSLPGEDSQEICTCDACRSLRRAS